jgi:hypothetical protein
MVCPKTVRIGDVALENIIDFSSQKYPQRDTPKTAGCFGKGYEKISV